MNCFNFITHRYEPYNVSGENLFFLNVTNVKLSLYEINLRKNFEKITINSMGHFFKGVASFKLSKYMTNITIESRNPVIEKKRYASRVEENSSGM